MSRMKIMIVEDDLIISMGLETDLIAMGFDVVYTETNGEEAVNNFIDSDPDIVLLDIDLGSHSIDGIEVAKRIKQLKNIPIIFLSGLDCPTVVESAKEVNYSYYLIKPCNKRQLQISIDFAIKNFIDHHSPNIDESLQSHEPLSNLILSRREYFFIKKNLHYIKVNVPDIVFIKAESPGNNIRITTDYTSHFMSIGLKTFENQVLHPYLFRIHRSTIINIEKIIGFNGHEVIVACQDKKITLSIGNTYKENFHQKFLKLKSE